MTFGLFSTPQPQQQTSSSLFQPQSGSLFSQPQQQPSPFQPQQQSSPFQTPQQQSSPFQTPQQQQQQPSSFQPQLFQQLQNQQQNQQQQQQQVQQLFLFTNDKAPAYYSTKWADLHPDSQKFLLMIEEKMLEYKSESLRLDQCSRLYDSSISSEGFESDASRIRQELGGITTTMDRQKVVLQELMVVVRELLHNAEIAVRSFMMLHPRFSHPTPGGAVSGGTQTSQAQGANQAPSGQQQAATSIVQVPDFYIGVPKKPSPFLQQTIVRFEKYLDQCNQWVKELENFLALDSDKYTRRTSLIESLPQVISNAHGYFMNVAAKVENIHQYIESMRKAYIADQRRRGEYNDPFLEADRREIAKQEAVAKRVHPTLHLPASTTSAQNPPQGTPGALNAPPTSTATPTPNPSPLFATPSSAAPTSSLFGPSATPSQPSLFGSSPASTSLFGQTTPIGAMPSQFGGVTPNSGASFGSMTKSSRPKSRTVRR